MNTKAVGEQSEGAILARVLAKGFSAAIPFGNNQRYDLVIDEGGALLRVQCKTGRLKNGALRFNTKSTNGFTGETRGYMGQADVFMVYCPENSKVYRIPVMDHAGACNLRLRISPAKNSQKAGIKWAVDYEF